MKRRFKIILAKERAGQFRIVKLATKNFGVDERRTEYFKRPCCAATFGNVCTFEKTHAGINRGGAERWHVRRRHHPPKAGLIKPHRALPIFHRQDRQPTIEECFVSELSGQFANRAAMPSRNRMQANKGSVFRIEGRSFGCNAVDWVWSIKDQNMNACLLTGAHTEIHRPNERVIARADILKINKEKIDIVQHFPGWLAMVAVETVDWNAELRVLIAFPFHHVVLGLAMKTVLRAEERTEAKEIAVMLL